MMSGATHLIFRSSVCVYQVGTNNKNNADERRNIICYYHA